MNQELINIQRTVNIKELKRLTTPLLCSLEIMESRGDIGAGRLKEHIARLIENIEQPYESLNKALTQYFFDSY